VLDDGAVTRERPRDAPFSAWAQLPAIRSGLRRGAILHASCLEPIFNAIRSELDPVAGSLRAGFPRRRLDDRRPRKSCHSFVNRGPRPRLTALGQSTRPVEQELHAANASTLIAADPEDGMDRYADTAKVSLKLLTRRPAKLDPRSSFETPAPRQGG
jgi:hypothetical protein